MAAFPAIASERPETEERLKAIGPTNGLPPALQRALAKGLAFAHNNPDKLRDIYPTFTTLQPELARKIVLSYTPEKSDFTQLKKIADLMDRLQMLPGKTQLPDVAMPR